MRILLTAPRQRASGSGRALVRQKAEKAKEGASGSLTFLAARSVMQRGRVWAKSEGKKKIKVIKERKEGVKNKRKRKGRGREERFEAIISQQ